MIRLIVSPRDNLVQVIAEAERLSGCGLVRVFWFQGGKLRKVGDLVNGPDSIPAMVDEILKLKGGDN